MNLWEVIHYSEGARLPWWPPALSGWEDCFPWGHRAKGRLEEGVLQAQLLHNPWAVWQSWSSVYLVLCYPVRSGVPAHATDGTTSQTEIPFFFLTGHILLWKKPVKFLMERNTVLCGWRCYNLPFCFLRLKPNRVPPVFSLMAIMLLHFSLLRWEVSGSLFVHSFKTLLELLLCFPFYLTCMSLCEKRGEKRSLWNHSLTNIVLNKYLLILNLPGSSLHRTVAHCVKCVFLIENVIKRFPHECIRPRLETCAHMHCAVTRGFTSHRRKISII